MNVPYSTQLGNSPVPEFSRKSGMGFAFFVYKARDRILATPILATPILATPILATPILATPILANTIY